MAWLWLWADVAAATVPLPDFREALARQRWREVDELLTRGCAPQPQLKVVMCQEGVTKAALEHIDAFRDQVFEDAGLEYLAGLAHRYDGEDAAAIRRLRAALRLDPAHRAAWYDIGELYLKGGRYDKATEAFERVSELLADGENSWLGPWRLAEVAAHQSDAATFEGHIKRALQRGFSFQHIAGLPNWQRFYADPALTDTIDKLLTVYAAPGIADTLRQPPE
ncbi:MAG: tetratricopeptide repeat protein [Myxococcales bacterium]|nr:tetratricopeptide repeat protein [Myxococcales bacterium]